MTTYSLIHADVLEGLADIPSSSVQTVVTSPPYYGQRLYGDNTTITEGDSLDQYINWLVTVFDGVAEVLKPDGAVWLNLGDAYTSGNRKTRAPDAKNSNRSMSTRPPTPHGLKEKELIGLPWRVAFALQEHGWYLRSRVIWHKPNAQPESVKDRPTQNLEEVFLLTRSAKYFYNAEASVEEAVNGESRRLRSLWSLNTEKSEYGHPAIYPTALAERCLSLTGKPGQLVLDPFNGSGSTGVAALSLGMRYIGIEAEKSYLDNTRNRLGRMVPNP